MPLSVLVLRPAEGPSGAPAPRGFAQLLDVFDLAAAALAAAGPPRPDADARTAALPRAGAEPSPAAAVAHVARTVDTEEAEWIRRARGGDEGAFRRLVERHGDRAYGLALRIVRDASEAEEVAQDAFLRAWRALPGFRGEAAFSTWLHRIVVRRALDRAQVLRGRRARTADVALDTLPDAGAARAPDLETVAKRRRIEALVAELPAAQRSAITLYYFHDRSVLEVARILGLPENTVKTHLSRARVALRDAWLGAEGEA